MDASDPGRSGDPKKYLFYSLGSAQLALSATMSPELQHNSSAKAATDAPRLIIKALRLFLLNLHIHPAPSQPYAKLLAMSSNPVERAQSRGREPLYVSLTPSPHRLQPLPIIT